MKISSEIAVAEMQPGFIPNGFLSCRISRGERLSVHFGFQFARSLDARNLGHGRLAMRASTPRRKSHRRETGGKTSHLNKKLCAVSAIFKYNPRSTPMAYVHRRGTAMNTQSSSSSPCPPHTLGPNAPAHAAERAPAGDRSSVSALPVLLAALSVTRPRAAIEPRADHDV